MISGISTPLFYISAVIFGVMGIVLIFAGIAAIVRVKPLKFTIRMLTGLLLLTLGALAAAIAAGMQGYMALTREEVAARITVNPIGAQRFSAIIRFPGNREETFELAGDEIYIDARIIKWKPLVNVFGLHTAYELDRIGGRYQSIEDESSAVRTVYSLGRQKAVDLFGLRGRYDFLSVLLDAEYGSATFLQVTRPAELEVRVSTSGLLMREAERSLLENAK